MINEVMDEFSKIKKAVNCVVFDKHLEELVKENKVEEILRYWHPSIENDVKGKFLYLGDHWYRQ